MEVAVRRRWGQAVFGADGHIDRARLAEIVFAPRPQGRAERTFLEQLTHPEIGSVLARLAAALQRPAAGGRGGRPVAF